MAATNYTPIQLYRTTTAGAAPSAANLAQGELAININDADMALYAENASGAVKRLMNNPAGLKYPAADGTSGQVITTNGAGTLTFTTAASGDVTLTGVQTLTNKTIEAGSFTNGYTEEVYALAGTEINPANGSIQTKTLSGNTTFTETIADGQSVVLMLNPSTFTTTWPAMSWVSPAGTPSTPPTLKASVVNVIVLWQVGGVLYGVWAGSV